MFSARSQNERKKQFKENNKDNRDNYTYFVFELYVICDVDKSCHDSLSGLGYFTQDN